MAASGLAPQLERDFDSPVHSPSALARELSILPGGDGLAHVVGDTWAEGSPQGPFVRDGGAWRLVWRSPGREAE